MIRLSYDFPVRSIADWFIPELITSTKGGGNDAFHYDQVKSVLASLHNNFRQIETTRNKSVPTDSNNFCCVPILTGTERLKEKGGIGTFGDYLTT